MHRYFHYTLMYLLQVWQAQARNFMFKTYFSLISDKFWRACQENKKLQTIFSQIKPTILDIN